MKRFLVPLVLACAASPAFADLAPTAELDPSIHYPVPLDDSPSLGPEAAPITIVATSQFPDLYVHAAWPMLLKILADNSDVRIVIKNFVVYPKAERSSIAACAAAYQDQLDAMEAAIYDTSAKPDPKTGKKMGLRELSEKEIRKIAKSLKLDMKKYDRDLVTCAAGQKRDHAKLSGLGQMAVPVFWINGRPLVGRQPIENFDKMIGEERAAWEKAKAAGASLSTYYKQVTGTK